MAICKDSNTTRRRSNKNWIYDMERQRFDSNINWTIMKPNWPELKNDPRLKIQNALTRTYDF
jgi:hypothetical protein